jgi:hypothetical protein
MRHHRVIDKGISAPALANTKRAFLPTLSLLHKPPYALYHSTNRKLDLSLLASLLAAQLPLCIFAVLFDPVHRVSNDLLCPILCSGQCL